MNPAGPSDGPIPVTVITGFLGSGKSTLANRLLKSAEFERAAVVINEYGEIGVDHIFVDAPRRRLRMVDSGCLCGHVHEEVASRLLDLQQRRSEGDAESEYDCVLIETSGLADPVPIVQILLTDREVMRHYALRSVITVADGLHGVRHLEQHIESVKQAAVADTFIIAKTDLADRARVDTLRGRLAAINPSARMFEAAHGEIDPAVLASTAGFSASERPASVQAWLNDAAYTERMAVPATDGRGIQTFTLEHDDPVTLPGFVLWMNLLGGLKGAGLLRAKGVVNVEGRPYAMQIVQNIISEPVPLENWPEGFATKSRLVFITRGIGADEVRQTFRAFACEAGRAPRNMTIDPARFAAFRETIQIFR
ncbi:MAG: CobW family GTP-binding protein [Burkholderiales bacterium]